MSLDFARSPFPSLYLSPSCTLPQSFTDSSAGSQHIVNAYAYGFLDSTRLYDVFSFTIAATLAVALAAAVAVAVAVAGSGFSSFNFTLPADSQ